MRPKAIRDLSQLSDPDFFGEVAAGLELVHQNATHLDDDARLLCEAKRAQGCAALSAVAAEEAAKYLILLDAVRCPREPAQVFSRQLGRFNDHLSKGLYAEYCKWRPGTFGEVEQRLADERVEFYLDGPNDVDWIFRNQIIDRRESAFYVDYAQSDDGHRWLYSPKDYLIDMGYHPPSVVSLVRDLHAVGFATSGAIAVIADVWRPVVMTSESHWRDLRKLNHRTLEMLNGKGLLAEAPDATYAAVIDHWLFPLSSLDLGLISVSKDDLRKIQDNWGYREMGL